MHGHQTCAYSVFLVAAGLCLLLHCSPAGYFPLWSDCGQCEGRQWCLLWFCIIGHSGLCLPMLGLQEGPAESTETKVKC